MEFGGAKELSSLYTYITYVPMYYYYVLKRALGCLPMLQQPLALSQSCRDHSMKYSYVHITH